MKRTFGVLLLVAAALPVALAAEGDKCDLKHVSTGLWCEGCKAILDPADTLEGKYCAKCCKDKAPAERVEAKKVKVCTKTYYRCAQHGVRAWKPGKCATCQADMEKVVDRALVTLKCEGCGAQAEKPGPCANEECKAKKKMIVETCARSGTYPHVAEK
jgi:hypothetical protein